VINAPIESEVCDKHWSFTLWVWYTTSIQNVFPLLRLSWDATLLLSCLRWHEWLLSVYIDVADLSLNDGSLMGSNHILFCLSFSGTRFSYFSPVNLCVGSTLKLRCCVLSDVLSITDIATACCWLSVHRYWLLFHASSESVLSVASIESLCCIYVKSFYCSRFFSTFLLEIFIGLCVRWDSSWIVGLTMVDGCAGLIGRLL